MLDILKNFDDASQGNKPAGPAQVGSMKAILEGFNRASTSTDLEECGTPMEGGCMSPEPMRSEGNPVTMNVSLTASGKDNVDELISLMKMAGVSSHDHSMATPSAEPDMSTMRALVVGDDDSDVEEWANSPEGVEGDAEYQDDNYMTKDLAGGLNREKKAYRKAQDGDNAMALENSIKKELWAALNEKKKCKK